MKYSFPDNIIEGISQGNPVKIKALTYSNKDNSTIIIIKDVSLYLVNNLANKNANPQKMANRLGKKITANGMKWIWYVSATIKAEPIQYKPNKNHPNPRAQPAKNVCLSEDNKDILYIPNPKKKIVRKKEKGGTAKVDIAPKKKKIKIL